MKKKLLILSALMGLTASVFAYNPPLGGEDLFRLTHPQLLGGAASASGGPLCNVVPASIVYNPALAVYEQRIDVDLSFSGLINTNKASENDKSFGTAFQAGLIIPTKWFVYSGTVQGVFADFENVALGNSINIHGGVSKEINEKLAVGMNLYTGFYMGSSFDWTLGADLGVLYQFDEFKFTKNSKTGFLTEPRLGVALLNCGKPVKGYATKGIYDKTTGSYPGICNPKVSFAANLINPLTKNLDANGNPMRSKFNSAFSADLSFPSCQNVIFDGALGFTYDDIVNLTVGWQANMMEIITNKTAALNWPSVCLAFRFSFNSSKFSGNNEDWAKSEISPVAAWQNIYNGIHVISGEARLNLGMDDEEGPQIILWDEE